MIAKFKQAWYNLFNKGGKEMPTTESTSTRKLREQVKKQSNEISTLRDRFSDLVDDIHILKNNISRFKSDVAEDMKMIVEKIEK